MTNDPAREARVAAHAERVSADLDHGGGGDDAWFVPDDDRLLPSYFAPRPRCRICGGTGRTYSTKTADGGRVLIRYTACVSCRAKWKVILE